jgi:hypothetical protein
VLGLTRRRVEEGHPRCTPHTRITPAPTGRFPREHRDRAAARGLQAALKERVDDETYTLIQEAIEVNGAASTSWAWALVAEIARLLPMVAPILPGLLGHVAHQDIEDQGRCCVLADPARGS